MTKEPAEDKAITLALRIVELTAENKRLRAVLQDIADDPVISEPLGMKRGVSHMLAIARNALAGNVVNQP